ncbi:A disintegrin and metallo ase with thrombospondin motifs 6-like [Paramuricea clavata]|uniref:A disintegrin and metallo ase with thrombospondin motifs 6-like n=1 Tax=Paramuricea clavata TaxID=317549 RepID=A0A6S7I9R2_PARCT|nr:A disintegrin and metallo ase with thrombospondin motifs 6-like [Paramuricea clavata]
MFTKKSKLEKYVQTMMDLASDVYKHQSLSQHGVKIHLVVSKIELLQAWCEKRQLRPVCPKNHVAPFAFTTSLLMVDTNSTFTTSQCQGDKCLQLRCEIPRYPNLCKISQRPLDGTKCGVNKWCMAGKCRTKTK